MTPTYDRYRAVQSIAKAVLGELGPSIRAADTEASIASRAVTLLEARGVTATWYHDCPAYVLLGSRSCASMSGRNYCPAEEPVGDVNLVTVDLSPLVDGAWGDCARSFCIEGGRFTETPNSDEFRAGLRIEAELHELLVEHASPDTTFHDLYVRANDEIASRGWENLDFHGNLGHSIERTLAERCYIDARNPQRLGAVAYFTFEPHVRRRGGRWGFKHENIYHFVAGRLVEL